MFKGLTFFIKCGWKYDRRYILWLIFYQLANSFIPIVGALAPKYIINELIGDRRLEKLLFYVGVLAGYTALAGIASIFFRLDGFTRRCHVAAAFDSDLHRHLAESDFENLEKPEFLNMQEKAKKFLYCDYHGFGYLLDCALNIAGRMITLLGVSVMVASLSPWIILLFVLLSVLGTAIEGNAKKKAMRISMESSADERGRSYYAGLFEKFDYGKELRLNSMGDWLLARERKYFTAVNQNLKRQNDTYIKSGIWGTLFTFIQQGVAYAFLIGSVLSGTISIGSFTMYISAVTVFAASLRAVMDSLVEIRAYDMYYGKLDEYLSTPAKLRQSGKLAIPRGDHQIEFRNVGFQYSGADTWALRHINVTIHPGEKITIVGENGAGKTTFVKLLVRLYEPSEGEILLDGVPISQFSYDRYMALFSTVFQDYQLFSLSLKENISLSLPCDEGRVKKVLRDVGLGAKLDSLPKGIDTMVYKEFDAEGFEPSGGEGQKIALARALYKDAPMVVLDEPTAALDPRAEYELYRKFDELVRGKTAVYISHRLSSTRFCDRILVFECGSIAESGTHEQLIRNQGKYAELFRMQAQYYV